MSENVHDKKRLAELQALPLERKILITQTRIIEWYTRWKGEVYVSFSGGKDSTVLADMVARVCSQFGYKMYLLFANTGLEYPEIQKFTKAFSEWLRNTYGVDVQLDIVRPEMRFDEVLKAYGYPVVSKEVGSTIYGARNSLRKGVYSHRLCKLGVRRDEYGGLFDDGKFDYDKSLEGSKFLQTKWRDLLDVDFKISSKCCDVMKKKPAEDYEKQTGRKPILGVMTCESINRETAWIKHGCNAFSSKRPKSTPMAFWTEQDVLHYLKKFNIPYCSVYGDIQEKGLSNGCDEQLSMFDCPGCRESEKALATTGCDRTGCIFCAYGAHLSSDDRFLRLRETHPRQYEYCIGGGEYNEDGTWIPNKQGLGMSHVFDELNKIYGENFIRYK